MSAILVGWASVRNRDYVLGATLMPIDIRLAIKEMSDEDLKPLLRAILVGGDPKDETDRRFVHEVAEEIHLRGLDKELPK